MKKKALSAVFAALAAACVCAGFSACGKTDAGSGAQNGKISEIYASYVAHAEENGDTPLSYEEWLATIKGEKGDKGDKGDPGAQGEKGADGKDGKDGADGKDGTCSCEKDKPQTEEEKIKADYIYTITNGEVRIDSYIGNDREVKIPDKIEGYPVKEIGTMAFMFGRQIESLSIPDNVYLYENAFPFLMSLKKLYLGTGIDSNIDAFYCSEYLLSLQEIHIGDLAAWCEKGSMPGLNACADLYIDGVKTTEIVIPESVTKVNENAFYKLSGVYSITIPNTVKTVEENALAKLNGATIYCETESAPEGWVVDNYFPSCTNGTPVVWDCKNNDVADDGYIYTVYDGLRYALKDGKAEVAEQPYNVTRANIKTSISYKKENYEVAYVSSDAFGSSPVAHSQCGRIQYKNENGVLYLGSDENPYLYLLSVTDAFKEKELIVNENCLFFGGGIVNKKITKAVLPDGLISISAKAFSNVKLLTTITIPESVKYIGKDAFPKFMVVNCEAKSKPAGWAENWNGGCTVMWDCKNNDVAEDGFVYTVADGLIYRLQNEEAEVAARQPIGLVTARIPACIEYKGANVKVTKISDIAFSYFYRGGNLRSVTIGDNVKSFGTAFRECGNLKSVTIGSGVTSIGDDAINSERDLRKTQQKTPNNIENSLQMIA